MCFHNSDIVFCFVNRRFDFNNVLSRYVKFPSKFLVHDGTRDGTIDSNDNVYGICEFVHNFLDFFFMDYKSVSLLIL